MNYFITLALVVIASFSSALKAEDNKFDPVFLSTLVNNIKETAGLPSGTAVAVVYKDKLIYRGDFGYQDIENQVAVSGNTQFYIASTTKPFTALNYLLDAKKESDIASLTLSQMFPNIQITGRNSVTAKHLLTHTASINNLPLVLGTAYSGQHSPKTLTGLVNELSVNSKEPVGEFKYTNVGYNIYSVFSDKFFDQSWQEKLEHQIFQPAGMLNTNAKRSAFKTQEFIAKPYSLKNLNRQASLYLEKQDETMHAAGGMFATSSDLAKFLTIQLNQGMLDDKQVFPSDIIEQSQQRQVATDKKYLDFKRDGYAWGWYTGYYKNNRMLHHFGGFAGAHAHLSFMPEQGIGLVVLNNEDFLSSRLTSLIADYVYGALLGEANVEEQVTERAKQLKAKLAGLDQMLTKERDKISSRKWNLSLALDAYVGEYKHPLLGTVLVNKNDNERFDIQWGVMHSGSTGMNDKDKIRVELEPTSGSVIQFNVSDKVDSLIYAGIAFTKTK